jgi:hypothetical protein
MASLTWSRVATAGAIGVIAWRGQFWAMPLSILVPCLIAAQPTRSTATATSFAYYAAASLPVIGVAEAYWPSSQASAIFMWVAAAALLSVPWFICWTRKESLRPWTAAIAVVLTALPPLCIIGWASPLLSAGVLFPNSAWLGIAAALALPGLLIHKRTRLVALVVASVASLLLNIAAKPLSEPIGWEGEMTSNHRQPKPDDLADFVFEEQLQQTAQDSPASVLVFPEGAVRRWTDATDAFWEMTLSHTRKTLLIGTIQPIPGSDRYHNSVVIVGKHAHPAFHQRVPVPGGMWNPLRTEGSVVMNLFGNGTVVVGGERAAILICYEQLLTWPILRSARDHPTLLVAISNLSWCKYTVLPSVQRACMQSWARLYGLPLVSAVNI